MYLYIDADRPTNRIRVPVNQRKNQINKRKKRRHQFVCRGKTWTVAIEIIATELMLAFCVHRQLEKEKNRNRNRKRDRQTELYGQR